jgi:NTP pyrophosphatase (non-canonical NTP hydrolase)|tara:strand:- start:12414 stop:12740 length:327 start_codon:yes stop_codon:yes gene_type:complete
MDMNAYQAAAKETAVFPPDQGIVYTALGLASEAGEVADKVKKAIRDKDSVFSDEVRESIKKELGDVLWYVSGLAWELGYSLDEVAAGNIAKLASRYNRGTIGGSGDDR